MPDITAKFSTDSLAQIEGAQQYANSSNPAIGFDDGSSTTGILQSVGQAGTDTWECKLVTEGATPDEMRKFAKGFRLFVETKTNNDPSIAPADIRAMLAAAESAAIPPSMNWDEWKLLDKADIAKETDKADPKTGLITYNDSSMEGADFVIITTPPPAGTKAEQVNSVLKVLGTISFLRNNNDTMVPANVEQAMTGYKAYLDKYVDDQQTFESEFYKALTPTTTPLEGEYDINDYFNDEYTVSISKTDANKTGETFSPEKQGYAITLKLDPTGWDNDLDEKWESGTWTIKTDLRGLVTSITFSNDYSLETNLAFQSTPAKDFTVADSENNKVNSFSVGLDGNTLTPKIVTPSDVIHKLQYILSLAPTASAINPNDGRAFKIKLIPQELALLTVIGNQLKQEMGLKLEDDESTFLDREKFAATMAPPPVTPPVTPPVAASVATPSDDPAPPTTPTSGGIDVTQ